VDQHGVRARLGVGRAAAERLLLAQPGDQRLRARHDQHAAGRRLGRFDLALELADRDQLLPPARSQAAVLHGVAEAGVDVGHHRGVLRFPPHHG
jgi:hypothetical protein